MTAADAGAPLRVVLVDDHAIVRQGLRTILERQGDLVVVGEAGTVDGARTVVADAAPDIVLLDVKLSTGRDTEGLALCAELTERYPDLGVLVLSTFGDDELVVTAVQHGARGYVVKDVDTSGLIAAIRAVGRRESTFDARSAGALARSVRAEPRRRELTERERKVLALLAHGMSNREIAGKLYISETTVKFHVRNLMRKLRASSRTEVVYAAGKQGLL